MLLAAKKPLEIQPLITTGISEPPAGSRHLVAEVTPAIVTAAVWEAADTM